MALPRTYVGSVATDNGRIQTVSEVDYVKDGKLMSGSESNVVQINSQSELADIAGNYTPGSIAYTAGFKAMWQMNNAGEWVSII